MGRLAVWLRRVVLGSETENPPLLHLSREQAIALARDATKDDPLSPMLTMTTVRERDGNATWIVSTAVIGLTLVVEIDDATGRTLRTEHLGVR